MTSYGYYNLICNLAQDQLTSSRITKPSLLDVNSSINGAFDYTYRTHDDTIGNHKSWKK